MYNWRKQEKIEGMTDPKNFWGKIETNLIL